jgi:hypothetical protein
MSDDTEKHHDEESVEVLAPDEESNDAPVPQEEQQSSTPAVNELDNIRPEPLNLTPEQVQLLEEPFDLESEVQEHPTKGFKCGKCGSYHDALYVPWNNLALRLNEVFGLGQWQLVPRKKGYDEDVSEVSYDGVLFVEGKYAGDAVGSISWKPDSHMGKYDAIEAAKSSCLTRCCKQIMPGLLELWDKQTSIDYYHGNRGNQGNTRSNSKQSGYSGGKGRGNQGKSEDEKDWSKYQRDDGRIAKKSSHGDTSLWKAFNATLKDWAEAEGIDDFREQFKDFIWDWRDLDKDKGWSNMTPKEIDWILDNMEKCVLKFKEWRD